MLVLFLFAFIPFLFLTCCLRMCRIDDNNTYVVASSFTSIDHEDCVRCLHGYWCVCGRDVISRPFYFSMWNYLDSSVSRGALLWNLMLGRIGRTSGKEVPGLLWPWRSMISLRKGLGSWSSFGSIRFDNAAGLVGDPDVHSQEEWLRRSNWKHYLLPSLAEVSYHKKSPSIQDCAGSEVFCSTEPLSLHALYLDSVKRKRVMKMKRHKLKKRKKALRHKTKVSRVG
eukprot:g2942.t1